MENAFSLCRSKWGGAGIRSGNYGFIRVYLGLIWVDRDLTGRSAKGFSRDSLLDFYRQAQQRIILKDLIFLGVRCSLRVLWLCALLIMPWQDRWFDRNLRKLKMGSRMGSQ